MLGSDPRITSTVEKRFEILKVAWKDTQEKHELYVGSLPDDHLDEYWIGEIAERFYKCKIEIGKYLLDFEKSEKEDESKRLGEKEKINFVRMREEIIQELRARCRASEKFYVIAISFRSVRVIRSKFVRREDFEIVVQENLRSLEGRMNSREMVHEEYLCEISKGEVR